MEAPSGFRVGSYRGDPVRYITKYTPRSVRRLGSYVPLKRWPSTITLHDATYVLAHLPIEPGSDYQRLVRLSRIWQKLMQRRMYGPALNMLSGQCEQLYQKIYHSFCYYGDVPITLLPDKYWRQ